MPDAGALRRTTDLEKLRALAARMPGVLQILAVDGSPPKAVALRIHIPTASSAAFPNSSQQVSEVFIQLPDRYPFPPGPSVVFRTPIWNPNVYEGGKWCYGDWVITENLELFVLRLMKVIALDPLIINPASPANSSAAQWYQHMLHTRPRLFPTFTVPGASATATTPGISFRTIK